MCAAASLLARCVPPSCHTMWCEEPLSLLPLLLPRCNHAAPASSSGPRPPWLPHRTSRVASTYFQEEEAGEAIVDEKSGRGERRAAACEGAAEEEARDDGEVTESERAGRERFMVHDDGVVDLFRYLSQEAIIRSVEFSWLLRLPPADYQLLRLSPFSASFVRSTPWLWGIKRLGPKSVFLFPARIYVLVQEYVMLCYICYAYRTCSYSTFYIWFVQTRFVSLDWWFLSVFILEFYSCNLSLLVICGLFNSSSFFQLSTLIKELWWLVLMHMYVSWLTDGLNLSHLSV